MDSQLRFGLGLAVEAKALTDINATSGIQTQPYATCVLTTLRNGLTTLDRWLRRRLAGVTPSGLERRGAGAGLQQTPSST